MVLCNLSSHCMRACTRSISSYTTSIAKVHRTTYCRTYPTLLVFPDGSSTTIRYPEPRQLIVLPVDLNTLGDNERRLRAEKRRIRTKVQQGETLKVNFDPTKYINLIKKK